MENLKVKIKLIEGGKLPEYKREGDVCLDCYARLSEVETIYPSENGKIPLGFVLELPEGYEAVVRPRSGLSSNGIDVSIGTIDINYRGEVCAIVCNNSYTVSFIGVRGEPFIINNGDRICQLAIRKAPHVEWELVDELSETNRGKNGFGSSGK